jgi:hypothetical protein
MLNRGILERCRAELIRTASAGALALAGRLKGAGGHLRGGAARHAHTA